MKIAIHTAVCAALLASAALASPAAAQADPTARSRTAGVSLGLYLNGSAATLDGSDEIDAGRGGTLSLGFGFTENLSLFASATGAVLEPEAGGDDYVMAHADLGARFSLGSTRSALRPFVLGAVSGRALSFDVPGEGTLEARGTGFTGGVGLAYFATPTLALEAGLSYTVGKFSEGRLDDSDWVDLDDDALEIDSSRFDLGINWHP